MVLAQCRSVKVKGEAFARESGGWRAEGEKRSGNNRKGENRANPLHLSQFDVPRKANQCQCHR